MSFTVLKNYSDDTSERYPTSVTYTNNGIIYGSISNINNSVNDNKGSLFTYDINKDEYNLVNYSFINSSSWYPSALTFTNNTLYVSTDGSPDELNFGTLFDYTNLKTEFTMTGDDTAVTGAVPVGLTNANDDYIYVACAGGGANELGTIFKYKPTSYEVLWTCGKPNQYPNALTYYNENIYFCAIDDSNAPHLFIIDSTSATKCDSIYTIDKSYGTISAITVDTNTGIFYGATQYGGDNSAGTLFKYDSINNTAEKIYDFSGNNNEQNHIH